jgi:GNAT superfamily N-acetyltransferase
MNRQAYTERRLITTQTPLERQITQYEVWRVRHAIDPFWGWDTMSESVLWTSDARRMLWVSVHDKACPRQAAGYAALAFDATMRALEIDYVRAREQVAHIAVCLTFYVRAAYRRRGMGTALWQATCDWLAQHAPEIDHVVIEPPAQVGRDIARWGGFFKAPRSNEEQVLAFVPVRAGARLGGMAELVMDLDACEDAEIFAKAYATT